MSATVRKPPAKKVFADIKPIDSKHVEVHFDRVVRVNKRTRLDGVMAKIGDSPFAVVTYQGEDFALPYTVKTDSKKVDRSLGGLLKTRGIQIAKL